VGLDFQGVSFAISGDNGFGWLTQAASKTGLITQARTYLAPKVRWPTALAMAPATSDCPYMSTNLKMRDISESRRMRRRAISWK